MVGISRGAAGVSKHIAMLVRGASLNLVVLMLAACGDAQPYYPPTSSPPTSNPPTSNPPTPFVVVDVISLSTDDYGQTWVASVHGPIDNAQVTVDGRAADASALRNGDVALIRGTRTLYTGDGPGPGEISERIDSIDAYHLVVGVVDSADPSHARLVVMGQQVTVTGDTIVFDRLVSEGALAAAQPGEIVAVSGFLTASGDVVATRIARTDSQGEFLLRGLVSATDTAVGRFQIGGLDVDYAQAAIDRQEFPNGDPTVGDQVVVLADAGPTGGLLAAHSVTFVPRSLSVDEGAYVVLNAIVTRYGSSDDFDVAGLTARLECSGVDCESMTQDLAADAPVQLAGAQTTDGVVGARHLSLSGLQSPYASGETTVVGPIVAVDAGTGALTVLGFQLQPLVHTRFLDHRDGGKSAMSAQDLQVGDMVSAAGTYGGTPGLLIAQSIARVSLQDPQITTYRFARAEPAITVLGRSILTTDTTRWDQCGSTADAAQLFGGEAYIFYLAIGLPALAVDPLEAAWVSIDPC